MKITYKGEGNCVCIDNNNKYTFNKEESTEVNRELGLRLLKNVLFEVTKEDIKKIKKKKEEVDEDGI